MTRSSRHFAAAAAITAALALPSTAHADDPQPIATATGACAVTGDNWSAYTDVNFPAQPVNYERSLVRITMNGAAGQSSASFGGASGTGVHAAGEVAWTPVSDVRAGRVLYGSVSCRERGASAAATFEWMTQPTTPVSFSGVTGPGSYSIVAFDAPAEGQYRVAINVAQGAVKVSEHYWETNGFEVASGATRDFTYQAGAQRLTVRALEGPPARWSVAVVALPVAVTDFVIAPNAARQGTMLNIGYALSGQATVTARVLDPAGQPVRALAEQLAVESGERSLRWDGIDSNGREVPSGVYTVELTVSDATGQPQVKTAQVTLDNTPPEVKLPQARKLGRKRAIVATISDTFSPIKKAALIVNGRRVARPGPDGKIIYRPRHGWPRKTKVRATVTATDRLDNTASVSKTFRIR